VLNKFSAAEDNDVGIWLTLIRHPADRCRCPTLCVPRYVSMDSLLFCWFCLKRSGRGPSLEDLARRRQNVHQVFTLLLRVLSLFAPGSHAVMSWSFCILHKDFIFMSFTQTEKGHDSPKLAALHAARGIKRNASSLHISFPIVLRNWMPPTLPKITETVSRSLLKVN